MSETWGPEFFKEKLKEKLSLEGVKRRERISLIARSKTTEKFFRVKTSRGYEFANGRYTLTEDGLKKHKAADFWVFCFEEVGTKHVVIVPSEKLKSFIGKYGSGFHCFGLKLREKGVDALSRGDKEEDYSDYLDEKGWNLIKEALT